MLIACFLQWRSLSRVVRHCGLVVSKLLAWDGTGCQQWVRFSECRTIYLTCVIDCLRWPLESNFGVTQWVQLFRLVFYKNWCLVPSEKFKKMGLNRSALLWFQSDYRNQDSFSTWFLYVAMTTGKCCHLKTIWIGVLKRKIWIKVWIQCLHPICPAKTCCPTKIYWNWRKPEICPSGSQCILNLAK